MGAGFGIGIRSEIAKQSVTFLPGSINHSSANFQNPYRLYIV
ncbi:hypothetical protein AM1_B0234 (plasmid) [Acaryochloris marina MBIC11017]|uniref:Uncharacterized protein n=1 Tax=Acaryochloris marina (strain MBIC 11017) TaxID=329726 RepID=A8ZLC6_ACAM1|nr:hypothetical protein AM1_B0234 [Acaryochloris marina MBIC11017]